VIGEVLPGGPAALAGLRPGDIVLRVGGTDVRDDCEFDAVAFQRSCEPVDVVVARGAERRTVSLTPADGLSFLERACREGARGACNRRALVLWALARSEREKETAIEAFASACRVGDAEACANGGLLVQERPGRERDAVPMLERACALGSAPGCSHLAFLHATGTLVPRNDATATPLYVRSCELGDTRGCYNEALMFENGRGVPKDQARAVAAYREACEEGRNPTACTNLGFLVERGLGVAQSAERAVELYGRGCAGAPCQAPNLTGCVNLARSYRDGKGVAKDVARAARMFQDLCEKPVDPGDVGSAELQQARACALLGGLYLNGSGVPKDLAKGRSYSEIGCSKGDAFAFQRGRRPLGRPESRRTSRSRPTSTTRAAWQGTASRASSSRRPTRRGTASR
jgi:hypothetical protein